MKAHGDVAGRVHIFSATALESCRVASSMLGRLYPPVGYSFYRRLSGPQDQSGHKGAKKNLHSSDTWDRTRAIQPIAQHLVA